VGVIFDPLRTTPDIPRIVSPFEAFIPQQVVERARFCAARVDGRVRLIAWVWFAWCA
jgi:hypothetical protein